VSSPPDLSERELDADPTRAAAAAAPHGHVAGARATRPHGEAGPAVLALGRCTPVAEGYMRRVYAHPHRHDALVKVIRADTQRARTRGARNWLKRRGRTRQYVVFLREIREYLALRARAPQAAPISHIFGFEHTDAGLGLVVERLHGEDGALAPTLIDLFTRHGDAPWLREGIAALFDALREHHVVVSDVNPGNVVHGRGSDGVARFALVDGFGDKNVIPLCSLSKRYNAYVLRGLQRKLMRRIERLLRGEPLWSN
jgi:hypothetical protein